jgi:hypothetical protein
MDAFINIGAEALRLVPLIIIFYVPALMGVAIWRERGESYKIKAALMFAVGFGGIVVIHLVFGEVSTLQAVEVIGISLVQIVAALALASLTVYRLAD